MNDELVHVFEKAGLGKGPFTCIGMVEKVGPVEISPGCFVGSPGQPMGCCRFCGQGIRYCYIIRDRNGKTFDVGSDCVGRTGDTKLVKASKNLPEVRAANRAKREAKDRAILAELKAIFDDESKRAILGASYDNEWAKAAGRDVLNVALDSLPYCGAAGRYRNYRMIKRALQAAGVK